MFLALVVCQFALAAANPFHKYPYVFLLDIGNEELEKTNTEQIRVSVPGSSLALRYPAIGEGDTISHVRVSGIDFGTDLKANILDGGPGSRYVVLVFMGNPGVPYDAVVTIQTVSDNDIDNSAQTNVVDSISNTLEDDNDSSEVNNDINNDKMNDIDVANDSSEDLSDYLENDDSGNKNAEVTQESSNVYVKSGSEYDSQRDDKDHDDIEDAIKKSSLNKQNGYSNEYYGDSNSNEQSTDEQAGDIDKSNQEESQVFDEGDDNNESIRVDKINSYDQYVPKPMYNGVRLYPQMRVPFVLSQNARYNPEDVGEDEEVFDNKDNRSQSGNVKDSNNNNFDSDDSSAIAY